MHAALPSHGARSTLLQSVRAAHKYPIGPQERRAVQENVTIN